MKIIAIIDNTITAGGGFSQALNAILQMQRICVKKFEFEVFTSQVDNVTYLQQFGITAVVFKFSLLDKFLSKVSISSLWQAIQNRLKIIGSFENKLTRHGCDIVYFVTPSCYAAALQKLNYIATVWDSCHRDTPEFPEIRNYNQFFIRERNNHNYLSPAVAVLVDSMSSVDSVSFRYGVDRTRLLAMPFTPNPYLCIDTFISMDDVLRKYHLNTGYFFYPAQFWAHKNHIRILEALLILNAEGANYQVVFSGGDQGNKEYIEEFIKVNNLGSQVSFLGFVPAEEMRGLYEGCQAVIMPTYFGPTNVPPLEAWMIEKPLIYSEQFSEQTKDAAILVNPDDASELALAMTSCLDELVCKKLIKAGELRLDELNKEHVTSETNLLKVLEVFEKRLSCWRGKYDVK